MSLRGVIELPVKICTVVDGTVSTCETPSTRSEMSGAVSAASMCAQLIAAPLGILSQTRHAKLWRRPNSFGFHSWEHRRNVLWGNIGRALALHG
jgi:hypothetical protein